MVHLVDFLKECFDGDEGGQGIVRARISSPLLYFLQYLAYRFVPGLPSGLPGVCHVFSGLVVGCRMPSWFLLFYRGKSPPQPLLASQKGDLVPYFVSFNGVFVHEFGYRHASQRFQS